MSRDNPARRAVLAQRAEEVLIAKIEDLRHRLQLSRTPDELVKEIKATMHVPLPPTVSQ
jgi:hypothetical protein